jgi:hypothetical protein
VVPLDHMTLTARLDSAEEPSSETPPKSMDLVEDQAATLIESALDDDAEEQTLVVPLGLTSTARLDSAEEQSSETHQESMDLVEDQAATLIESALDDNVAAATETDTGEGWQDLTQPGMLASNFPPDQHACAITAIAVSVLATSVPYILTEARMADLLRDLTIRDLVSHCLIEKIREDSIECPRHLGEQVMTAWQFILEAEEGPFPPEAMLPLHVVIPFLPPGAILLFPRVGEQGFWVKIIAMDGPLLPEEVATAIETSPILVVITATSQEGVAHMDTISKLDWKVRLRLADQAMANPGAFEQGTVLTIPPEVMHSLCGSGDPAQTSKETQTAVEQDAEGPTEHIGAANPEEVALTDILTHSGQLVSRFQYLRYSCGLVAIATGVLWRSDWLTKERTQECLTDPISGWRVNDYFQNIVCEGKRVHPGRIFHRARQVAAAWEYLLYAEHPLTASAMVPMLDVIAFAPKGTLLLRIRGTDDEFWVEVTDIHGRLEDEDIDRGLEEAPLLYVVSSNTGQQSVHVETLTFWDQEVQGLLVQQA